MKKLLLVLSLFILSLSASADCISELERAIEIKTPTRGEEILINTASAATIAGVIIANPIIGSIWGAGVIGVRVENKLYLKGLKKSLKIIQDAYEYKVSSAESKELLQVRKRYNRHFRRSIRKINREYKMSLELQDVSMDHVVGEIINYNEKGEKCVLTARKLAKKI